MTTRKRSGSGSKRQLKEKVVQIYESFFKGEELWKNNPTFWDEFFLLKPNVTNIENEIKNLSSEQLMAVKDNINVLFSQCVETLGHEHNLRGIVCALQTLCALVNAIYKKIASESGFDVINILIGFDNAETKMNQLLNHCNEFLTGKILYNLTVTLIKFIYF